MAETLQTFEAQMKRMTGQLIEVGLTSGEKLRGKLQNIEGDSIQLAVDAPSGTPASYIVAAAHVIWFRLT